MPPDYSDFESLLTDKIKERSLTLKRLSELSGIPPKHLDALLHGRFNELPPVPYIHGYIKKLGGILDYDAEIVWTRLKHSGFLKSSGPSDELPKNRFRKKVGQHYLWLAVLGVVLLAYGIFRLSGALGKPTLVITSPVQETAESTFPQMLITGTLHDADSLTVSGEVILVAEDGSWQKEIPLQPGLNTIEVTAKKFLGGETKLLRQIYYQPEVIAPTSTGALPAPLQ
ncbi:MAG: helix-turn-helix domain-containing protein [bacterium]|nr:helix-turn-helix domain-containing protein [bacterium]